MRRLRCLSLTLNGWYFLPGNNRNTEPVLGNFWYDFENKVKWEIVDVNLIDGGVILRSHPRIVITI